MDTEDFRLLQYYVAVMRVAAAVMCDIFLLLKPDNGKTIKEQLFDIPNYSSSRYKKDFTNSDNLKLENNLVNEFDITLLYKLLQKICGLAPSYDSQWNDSGTLENSLKQIKQHRNDLAHEKIFLTSNKLQTQLKKLSDLCENALLVAAQRSGKPVGDEIKKMLRGMDEVKHARLNLWEPYRQALSAFRRMQSFVLIQEARKDLKILSEKRKIISPFSWLQETDYSHLDVEPLFTKLEIMYSQGGGYLQIEQFLNTNLPDIFILIGAPGMGKTSLTRFIFQDWISSRCTVLGMENVDLVLPVELRQVFSRNVNDLLKNELLPSVPKHLRSDDILTTLRDVSLIWMLDGYDEASPETKGVVKEIFGKFPDSRIIITTRSEFTQEIKHTLGTLKKNVVTLQMLGFTEDNVELCAKKIIDASTKDVNKRDPLLQRFMAFVRDNEGLMRGLFQIPLFLSAIVLLWIDNTYISSLVSTRSAVCSLLIDFIVNRLLVKESYRNLRKTEKMLKEDINTFLDELGKLLWIDDNQLYLKAYQVDHLQEKCKELGLPFIDTMSAFFTSFQTKGPTGNTTYYDIIHRTLKEFLSARAFCNAMIAKRCDVTTSAQAWITDMLDTLKKGGFKHRYLNYSNSVIHAGTEDQEIIYRNYVQNITAFQVSRYMQWRDESCCRTDPPQHNTIINTLYEHKTAESKTTDYWSFLRDKLSRHVLAYIVGYLNFKKELNPVRAEQLVFLSFRLQIDGNSTDSFLDAETKLDHDDFYSYFREGVNSTFNKELSKLLKTLPWIICSERALTQVTKNLQYVVPKTVIIHCCITGTHETLLCIGTLKKYCLDVHLDFSPNLGNPSEIKEVLIHQFLREFLNPSCKARLVTLHCPLDELGVGLLQKTNYLKELSTRISLGNLGCLDEGIRKLSSLHTLRLAIDQIIFHNFAMNSLYIPDNVGRQIGLSAFDIYKHKLGSSIESLSFDLVVPEFCQVEPEILGKLIGKLCPALPSIILLRGSPIPYSFTKWNKEKITACIEVMHQHVLQIVSYADKVDKIEVVMFEYCGEKDKPLTNNLYEKYAKRSRDLLRKHSPETDFKLSIIERPYPSYVSALTGGNFVRSNRFLYSIEGNISCLYPPRVF